LLTWHASGTHLYPGARLRAGSPAARRGASLLIEFADLATAQARLEGRAGAWRLRVEPHRTQRGTTIAAKVWQVEPPQEPDAPGVWRVLRRAD
jgi:hypothetical protein